MFVYLKKKLNVRSVLTKHRLEIHVHSEKFSLQFI